MPKLPQKEQELVAEIKQKSERGARLFGELVQAYSEPIYWQIRRLLKSHELTNDTLQNVWIKVWENLESFQGESALYTWIYRIARNESLNLLKKEQRHFSASLDGPLVEMIPGQTHSHSMSSDEISAKLEAAIAALPEKQAMVFELKYFEEMKYSTMSELLQTSEGALKASYSIAVQKVQQFLQNH